MHELHPDFLSKPLAHRGLHDRKKGIPENSLSSALAAVEAGYGIEIDVQHARCGTSMVFHDPLLKRMTGRPGNISDLDATELNRIRLKNSQDTIPRLSDILRLVAGRAPLLIEVKDPDASLHDSDGIHEQDIARCLASYEGPVAVMSFNPHSVAMLAEFAPGCPRGLTTCDFTAPDWSLPDFRRAELAGIGDFGRTGSCFVSHNRRQLDNPAVSHLRKRGVPVLCWTVRSTKEEAKARRVADNITFESYDPGGRVDETPAEVIS